MHQSLRQLINNVLYTFVKWAVLRLDSVVARVRSEYLLSQLKSCGSGCFIQWPVQVSGHASIIFGDSVSIAAYVHIWGDGGVTVGNRVMIASHAAITSLTHDYEQPIMNTTLIKKTVVIEDDVWVGAHAVIVPGVTIGRGAVVGAGSIVTKDVEPFSIVAGIPARKIKQRSVNEMIHK